MYAKLLKALIAISEAAIMAIASDLAIKAAKKVTEKMEN
jgi:hypothetical protein